VWSERAENVETIRLPLEHRPIVLHAVLQADHQRPVRQARQPLANAAFRTAMKRAREDHLRPACVDPIGQIGEDRVFRPVAGTEIPADPAGKRIGNIDIEQADVVGVADAREPRGMNSVAAIAKPPKNRLPVREGPVIERADQNGALWCKHRPCAGRREPD
jgi:hypothetical protein